MPMWIRFTGTFEPVRCKSAQAERIRIEAGMLACQDEPGDDSTFGQRTRYWRQLDGFRPGPDDQPDIYAIQLSP